MYVKDVDSGLGKIKWYYKKATETSYNPYEEETTYTGQKDMQHAELKITGLSAGTEYNMYAEVYDILGNKTTSSTRTIETLLIPELITGENGNVKFEYSTEEWTKGNVTVTASTTVTGYTLQTSKDGDNWSSAISQTFTENGTMYARLWDGTNYGGKASAEVNNIDKTAPLIGTFSPSAVNCTTANLVIASGTDTQSKISKITWYYKESTASNYTSVTTIYTTPVSEITENTTKQISNIKYNTNYSAYVEVYDVVGNKATSSVITVKGNTTHSATTGGALKTAATCTNPAVYYHKCSRCSTQLTTTYESGNALGHNYVATELKDSNSTIKSAYKFNSATVRCSGYGGVEDQSGLVAGQIVYASTKTTASVASLDIGYYELVSKSVVGGTGGYAYWSVTPLGTSYKANVCSRCSAYYSIAFTYSPNGWTNGSITATAKVKTSISGYTLQTSKDGTNWSNATSQTFTSNGTMYARLYDGMKYGGTASATVNKIDKTAPTISTTLSSTAQTTNSITLSIGVKDTNSGISKIIWYYKPSTATSYSNTTDTYTTMNGTTAGTTTAVTKTKTISGLLAGTKYNIYAVVYDVAGNSKTSYTETNPLTVETYVELRNANSTIKNTYNFYGSVTPSAPAFGNGYINLPSYSGLSSGMIVYASSEASYGGSSVTKVGYYQLIANYSYTNETLTYVWDYAYLGSSCLVKSTTGPTELKNVTSSKKTLYNFYGEVNQGSPGYGQDYISLENYSNLQTGMIVYASNVGTYGNISHPIGYYYLTYESYDGHSGFWQYQYLGTTFKVY